MRREAALAKFVRFSPCLHAPPSTRALLPARLCRCLYFTRRVFSQFASAVQCLSRCERLQNYPVAGVAGRSRDVHVVTSHDEPNQQRLLRHRAIILVALASDEADSPHLSVLPGDHPSGGGDCSLAQYQACTCDSDRHRHYARAQRSGSVHAWDGMRSTAVVCVSSATARCSHALADPCSCQRRHPPCARRTRKRQRWCKAKQQQR